MTIIHTKAQNIKDAFSTYSHTETRNLWQAYGKPSYAKEVVWNRCVELMKEFDGYGLSVIGCNTNTFSAGFLCEIDGKHAFVWITKGYDRFVYLDEIDG